MKSNYELEMKDLRKEMQTKEDELKAEITELQDSLEKSTKDALKYKLEIKLIKEALKALNLPLDATKKILEKEILYLERKKVEEFESKFKSAVEGIFIKGSQEPDPKQMKLLKQQLSEIKETARVEKIRLEQKMEKEISKRDEKLVAVQRDMTKQVMKAKEEIYAEKQKMKNMMEDEISSRVKKLMALEEERTSIRKLLKQAFKVLRMRVGNVFRRKKRS